MRHTTIVGMALSFVLAVGCSEANRGNQSGAGPGTGQQHTVNRPVQDEGTNPAAPSTSQNANPGGVDNPGTPGQARK